MNNSDTFIMERNHLNDIPSFPLKEPYRIGAYEAGDELCWHEIHLEADNFSNITSDLFASRPISQPSDPGRDRDPYSYFRYSLRNFRNSFFPPRGLLFHRATFA